jgi:hypothetical protein
MVEAWVNILAATIKRPALSLEHPTMKPVELAERAIRSSGKPRDTVLYVCGGSGTTPIARAKSGPQAWLVKLEPKYCDVIVRRWQASTGGKRSLDPTGEATARSLDLEAKWQREVDRCRAEIAARSALLLAGHPDIEASVWRWRIGRPSWEFWRQTQKRRSGWLPGWLPCHSGPTGKQVHFLTKLIEWQR